MAGGIVGGATAYRLTEAGVPTCLIDAGEPGRGTSASSFAWLNSAHKHPRAYRDLNVAGVTHSSVTLGPLIGRHLAAALTGGDFAPDLAPFTPRRFATTIASVLSA